MRILLPIILILMLSSCSVQLEPEVIVEYVKVPQIVIKEVVREVEIVRVIEVDGELRDFASAEEFKEVISRYIDGLTVLNGDCVEGARFLVEALRSGGYYIDTEVVDSGRHMIIKGFIVNGAICYYDPRSNRFWHIYKDSTYQSLQAYSPPIPPDDEPNWGKGGKPKPDKDK